MKLILRAIQFLADGRLELEFLDTSVEKMVFAEFHYRRKGDEIYVTGSEPDVLQWCEGSAEDVRRIYRAIAAFVEAAVLDEKVC